MRKGQKATAIYFYKTIDIADKEGRAAEQTRQILMLRVFSALHASQTECVPAFPLD